MHANIQTEVYCYILHLRAFYALIAHPHPHYIHPIRQETYVHLNVFKILLCLPRYLQLLFSFLHYLRVLCSVLIENVWFFMFTKIYEF